MLQIRRRFIVLKQSYIYCRQLTSTTIATYKSLCNLKQCDDSVVADAPEEVNDVADKSAEAAARAVGRGRVKDVLTEVVADNSRWPGLGCIDRWPAFSDV